MASKNKYTNWVKLQVGDVVEVVAPGFGTTQTELDQALKFLEKVGIKAHVPKDIFGDDLICSQKPEVRLRHLKEALKNKKSKAIWCLRGGYGSLQLIPEVWSWARPKQQKLLIGYSDISTLFTLWNQKWKWPSLHGPLLDRLGKGDLPIEQIEHLMNILFGNVENVRFDGLKPLNKAAQKKKNIYGSVIGGNLTVVASSVGTPSALRPKNQIVFFEDTGERGYRIDRMLRQLQQSGFFKDAAAVLLGPFLGGEDKDGRIRVMEVWQQFAQELKIPVLSGIPSGHGAEQWALPMGTMAKLQTGPGSFIEIDTGAQL